MGGAGAWGAGVAGEGIGALLGSIAGLRLRPRKPMLVVCYIFLPTAVQSVLLAFHASVYALAPAAALARVGAYGWMSAMVFLPAGYALAGPIASAVGMRGYLLFGAVWLVASTLLL